MSNISDAWVDYRTSRDLRALAGLARQTHGVYVNGQLCIVSTIERLAASNKGRYEIQFFCTDDLNNLASVNYVREDRSRPVILRVDRELWEEAKLGAPEARYILAHELGHMLIHEGQRLHYSDPTTGRKGPPPDERSAEWQANIFAHFFLVSEEAMADDRAPLHIAHSIGVERQVLEAVRKYDALRDVFRFQQKVAYTGDSCGECGNFTLVRDGTCLKCDTCGSTTGV